MAAIPETLHHYTTAAGLMGIFEPRDFRGWEVPTTCSLTLWATDARYLNDAQELTFAAKDLADAMRDLVDRSDADHAKLIDELAERIGEGNFLDPEDNATTHSAYVTSFCKEPDLLSQWRGYGANGYSIEFPTEVLRNFLVPVMEQALANFGTPFLGGAELAPVQYKVDESFIQRQARKIVDPENRPSALRLALECLAQFKHPSFEEEQEWRLFVSLGETFTRCLFRVSVQGMLIPYLPLRFTPYSLKDPDKGPLYKGLISKSVWVGPSPDRQLRAVSVKRMLRQLSFNDVEVEISETPFRS